MSDDELRAAATAYLNHPMGPGGAGRPPRNSRDARDFARRLLELLPPADDGQRFSFWWAASVAERHEDKGYWDVPPSGDVWWEIGPLSFTCDTCQSDPGEPLETVAIDWQVDGEKLPKALWPKTRGDLRRLCQQLGTKLKESE